jgi:membrane protease YdiL (CAAX protease family)
LQLRDLHPRRFFLETWRELDAGAIEARGPSGRAPGAGIAAYVFVVVAVSLTLQEYLGGPQTFFRLLALIDDPKTPLESPFLFSLVGWLRPEGGGMLYLRLEQGGRLELWNLAYWALWRVFGFLVLPLVAVAIHPRLRFREMGFGFSGFARHAWIYGVLLAPVLVAVLIVSFTEDFSTYYPFYTKAHRSLADFAVWEAFYVAQFFSLEFFFRGFMLQPLRRSLGSGAIFAMMVPYVMIHFGKPLPECFAAIIAGIVLGTLAMRTRSIWAGFLIHVTVAVSMDLAAIWQTHW